MDSTDEPNSTGLESVSLSAHIPEFATPERSGLEFARLPSGLTRLTLKSAVLPRALFASSASTLNSLDLFWPKSCHGIHSHFFSGLFPLVVNLVIRDCGSLSSTNLAPELLNFVTHVPRLSRLNLGLIWPNQLQQLLAHLGSSCELDHLAANFWPATDGLDRAAVQEAEAEWEPQLRQCAKAPVLRRLHTWRITITKARQRRTWRVADGFIEQDTGDGPPSWPAFEADVAAAGVQLRVNRIEASFV